MKVHTSVAPLRDDLTNIYALLFRFLGYGFRLAMCSEGWLATQQFVILVPDPILFAPWPVLFDRGEPCHSLLTRHTTTGWSKVWDVEGVTCTAAHWSGSRSEATRVLALFFLLLFFFLLFRPLSQVDRRKTQLELEWPPVAKKRHWTLPTWASLVCHLS